MTLTLSPELIEAMKTETNFQTLYEPCEVVTAQHNLFKNFIESTKWPGMPKVVFYILLGECYGMAHEKDAEGYLGYRLKLIETIKQ